MAANGISTLTTKQAKQVAKLNLAQLKRQGYTLAADGTTISGPDTTKNFYRARNVYDITELPTQYSDNTLVDNPNPGGLIEGRPWISGASPTYGVEFRSWIGTVPDGTPGDIITTCNEGDVIYFCMFGTNIPDDSNAYLQFSGANITNQDATFPFPANLTDPIPFNIPGNLPPAPSVGAPMLINADNLTEGNEVLTLSWIVLGDIVATTSITIVDTSQTPI